MFSRCKLLTSVERLTEETALFYWSCNTSQNVNSYTKDGATTTMPPPLLEGPGLPIFSGENNVSLSLGSCFLLWESGFPCLVKYECRLNEEQSKSNSTRERTCNFAVLVPNIVAEIMGPRRWGSEKSISDHLCYPIVPIVSNILQNLLHDQENWVWLNFVLKRQNLHQHIASLYTCRYLVSMLVRFCANMKNCSKHRNIVPWQVVHV